MTVAPIQFVIISRPLTVVLHEAARERIASVEYFLAQEREARLAAWQAGLPEMPVAVVEESVAPTVPFDQLLERRGRRETRQIVERERRAIPADFSGKAPVIPVKAPETAWKTVGRPEAEAALLRKRFSSSTSAKKQTYIFRASATIWPRPLL